MLHFVNKKLNSPEVQRLEALLKRIDAKWRVEFQSFLESATSEASIRQIANLIEAGKLQDALEYLDSLTMKLAVSVIPPSFSLVGSSKTEVLAPKAFKVNPLIAIAFDPAHPRAAAIQQSQTLDFVRGFNNDQREVVNSVLDEAFMKGHNPLKAAREIKGAIGLTPRQWKAVKNYRTLLEEGSIEALGRELRDRRHDPLVERLFSEGKGLSQDQIDKMVERYTANYHKYRAEVIARTESGRTLSEANREAFTQTVEALQLPESAIIRTWNTTQDKRTRESHVTMDGQKVTGMNTPFITGNGVQLLYPGDPAGPAEEVIQCRCVETQDIGEVSDDYYS